MRTDRLSLTFLRPRRVPGPQQGEYIDGSPVAAFKQGKHFAEHFVRSRISIRSYLPQRQHDCRCWKPRYVQPPDLRSTQSQRSCPHSPVQPAFRAARPPNLGALSFSIIEQLAKLKTSTFSSMSVSRTCSGTQIFIHRSATTIRRVCAFNLARRGCPTHNGDIYA